MLTMDKILKHVPKRIIDTINECVQLQEKETLENWLKECKQEIEIREGLAPHHYKLDNIYPLYCEKAYLEMVLNNRITKGNFYSLL